MLFPIFIYAMLTVSVSVTPIKGIVEEIGGNYFTYEVVYPEGANPHLYEPKPTDILKIKKSDVFIYSGRAEPGGKKLCNLAKRCVSLESFAEMKKNRNPHLWLSPMDVYSIADSLAALFSHLEPEYRDTFLKRAQRVRYVIDSLLKNNQVKESAGFVLLMHGAFVPLFKQLGYKTIVVSRESGTEPGAAVLKTLRDIASKKGFVLGVCEEKRPCKIVKLLSKEFHFPVINLNPLYNKPFTIFLEDAIGRIKDATYSGK